MHKRLTRVAVQGPFMSCSLIFILFYSISATDHSNGAHSSILEVDDDDDDADDAAADDAADDANADDANV
jgi:hypothetical protein